MSFQVVLLRLTAAALLGSLVGLERHRSDKAAGMRTHMLVSLGSALFMIISVRGFDQEIRTMPLTLDPSRIAAQVVSGIGFLGAGTILRRHDAVVGLTTAASVWAVAAVGLAAGCGLYFAAVAATLLMLVVLAAVRPLEEAIAVQPGRHTLTLTIAPSPTTPPTPLLPQVEALVRQARLDLKRLQIRPGPQPGETEFTLIIEGRTPTSASPLSLIDQLRSLPGVTTLDYNLGPTA